MNSFTDQPRRVPAVFIVIVLFILSVVVSQQWLSAQFPTIAGLAQLKPTLVFLDIPIHLPVTIDLILVPALFIVSYTLVTLFFPSRPGLPFWSQTFQRLKAACAGLFAILVCVLVGGLIYYYAQDHLTTPVKNGINTFGFNLDMQVAYQGAAPLALRGSMVLFLSFIIGLVILIRKVSKAPKAGLTREQRVTPYERMLQERRMQQKLGYEPTLYVQHTTPVHKISRSGACDNHPVMTLKPLAVYYMPM